MSRSLIRSRVLTLVWSGCLAVVISFPKDADAADKAAVKRAIDRGAAYLKKIIGEENNAGRTALMAYAILKSGAPSNDPAVARVIADISERCSGGDYTPHVSDSIYAAGVDAMILADADPEKHQPELRMIAAYLISVQRADGSYSYRGPDSAGDVSVTQYAALGLWACARAGVEIPPETWDRLALWHMLSQLDDGGFQYNPGTSAGLTRDLPNLTMTAAGAATMTIAAMHLHPRQSSIQDRATAESQASQAPKDPNNPLGVLTAKTLDPNSASALPTGPYQPQASFRDIQRSVSRAVGWSSNNYTAEYRQDLRMYNYYTLERMGALTEVEELGGKNWFDDCGGRLIATQQQDGSWNTSIYDGGTFGVGTSFGVLFLTRSTAKLLNRAPPEDLIGGGMQAGGRGLPDDLSTVTMQDGRVAQEESMGPLDDLLKSLESAGSDDLFNLQQKIVKKIQLGDRNELIGQTDRLVTLLEYPRPEVRRTALWALARSDDLKIARYMVAALEDPDRDVLIEAHNALCWLSRRPNAFDIPDDPLAGLPPNATDEQKEAAVEKWRQLALQKWGQWYLRMSPYGEKDDPFMLDLERKIGLR